MKEFKKSAKERNKEMQFIGQARRAEERGDYDKVQMYEEKANTANQASARYGIAAINDITNAGGKASADILQNMRTTTSSENIAGAQEAGRNTRFNAEQYSQNARFNVEQANLNARAQMLTGDGRTAMMLGSGKTDAERLESGMKKLQEITADKSGMAAVKLLAETNVKLQAAGQPPVTMADLLGGAREFSALMYPKVADTAPTRERPR